MADSMIDPDRQIRANYHVNGGLAGATDYTMAQSDSFLVRVHRSGTVEVFGRASQRDWQRLLSALVANERERGKHS